MMSREIGQRGERGDKRCLWGGDGGWLGGGSSHPMGKGKGEGEGQNRGWGSPLGGAERRDSIHLVSHFRQAGRTWGSWCQ